MIDYYVRKLYFFLPYFFSFLFCVCYLFVLFEVAVTRAEARLRDVALERALATTVTNNSNEKIRKTLVDDNNDGNDVVSYTFMTVSIPSSFIFYYYYSYELLKQFIIINVVASDWWFRIVCVRCIKSMHFIINFFLFIFFYSLFFRFTGVKSY